MTLPLPCNCWDKCECGVYCWSCSAPMDTAALAAQPGYGPKACSACAWEAGAMADGTLPHPRAA